MPCAQEVSQERHLEDGFPLRLGPVRIPTWRGVKRCGEGTIGKRRICDYIQRPHEELYDLEADRDEVVNLTGQSGYADVLQEMRQKVEAWQEQTRDPWLYKDGVSLLGIRRYAEKGLEIPDRHDMSC